MGIKFFCLFFFTWYKMEQNVLLSGEDCINKSKFQIYEKSVDIDKVDIKRIVLSNEE